ncbi:hypothetical protein HD554DRAFT_2040655 [Boletus coccyginus]|nr:hypothetical protein HD554DRAFT_2040655 [Boletus coccyginus]
MTQLPLIASHPPCSLFILLALFLPETHEHYKPVAKRPKLETFGVLITGTHRHGLAVCFRSCGNIPADFRTALICNGSRYRRTFTRPAVDLDVTARHSSRMLKTEHPYISWTILLPALLLSKAIPKENTLRLEMETGWKRKY